MHIQLDANTKSWIQSKGKPVTVKVNQIRPCCVPAIQDLMTHLGKPKDLHNYKEVEIDDLLIFVDKHLFLNDKITLKLMGIGIFKTVTAKLC